MERLDRATLARLQVGIDERTAARVEPDEVETAAGIEAICSGALEGWARDLAGRVAVALAREIPAAEPSVPDPPRARGCWL